MPRHWLSARLLLAAVTLGGMALLAAPTTQAGAAAPRAAGGIAFGRLAGNDLYGTAATIATSTFGTSDRAVLATGAAPFDAAVGNYLSGVWRAPVLFTDPGTLPSATAGALASMHVHSVTVLGGTMAVGDAVVAQLQAAGYQVQRIAGADQYATAADAAEALGPAAVGTSGSADPTAVVTTGLGIGDLQAVGPLAYAGPFPVLFADGSGLPAATTGALGALGIRHVLVLGGPQAVPSTVDTQLAAMGITSERLAGADQYATAAAVANYEIDALGFTDNHVNVARGDDFADSLAGGPHAGADPAPMLLTVDPSTVGPATLGWLVTNCAAISTGTVLGGTQAVSPNAVTAMQTAATCSSGTTGGTGGGTTPPPPPPPSSATALTVSPESTYATVGSSTTVTATVTATGTPVPGVPVHFFVIDETAEGQRPGTGFCTLSAAAQPQSTGTADCTITAADPVTNAAGQATFAFHWASPVGQRPLEGSWSHLVYAVTGPLGASFDPNSTSQLWGVSHVVWVNATSSLQLSPSPATVHYGDTAQVSATLISTNMEGASAPVPLPDQPIVWSVYRGATCTAGATSPPAGTPTESGTATTDANGVATIRYVYAPDPVPEGNTTDCLFAFYDRNGDGLDNPGTTTTAGEVGNTSLVTWSSEASVASTLAVTPNGATALVAAGTSQQLAARVTDQYGAPVAGVDVSWTITRTGQADAVTTGSGTTDAAGQVAIADPSPAAPAVDTVSATAGTLTGTATATWVAPAASGSYVSGTIVAFQSTSSTSGDIDVAVGGTWLRLSFDANDVLKVGASTVQAERFTESLVPGATISADPYVADASGVSTFTVASSHGGGGGGHGGGGGGA